MIDALSAGELAQPGDGVSLAGIDYVCGAEAMGALQLGRKLVDANDAAGTADASALDDRQADAAAAEHGNRLAGLQARGAQRGADAGEYAAADQCGAVEGDVAVDFDQRVLVQQHLLGVAADVRK